MEQVTIVGAGIIGVCAALSLQKRGVSVRLVDQREPGTGTSYGNAGLLSVDNCLPTTMPGAFRQLPGWLTDPDGPLSIKPSYLPAAAPWLLRTLRAGVSESRVTAASQRLRLLHQNAMQGYLNLLGPERFHALIARTGQLYVWETAEPSASEKLGRKIQRSHDIEPRRLEADEVFQLVPEISRSIKRGELYENNGFVRNPHALVKNLFEIFMDLGGIFQQQAVQAIGRTAGNQRYRLITNTTELTCETLVLSAGAWSKRLLAPLGLKVPLDAERGYHSAFRKHALDIPLPVVHKNLNIVATPMADSVRVTGFVEIAGLDAPPDMRKETVLVNHAKRLFPSIDLSLKQSFWLGFRPSTPDSLPIIGPVPALRNLYLNLGHGHTGLTGAPASAELLSSLITGQPASIDAAPYGIQRFLA